MAYAIGILLIISSILNSYFASNFKRINYLFGLINYMLMGYVAFKNHIYGMFIFYILVFSPMQLFGYINWGKKEDNDKNVIVRGFSYKNRIILILSCVIFSFVLATILDKIPNAQFTLLDSFSNIINLSGVILMALRFNESWWLWLINNTVDLILWANVVNIGGEYSIFMLISSIIYILINIYGIIKWDSKIKVSIQNVLKISTQKEIEIISYIANTLSAICYFIISKKIGLIVTCFAIIQSVFNRLYKKAPHLLSFVYIITTVIITVLLKPVNIEFLIILCLLLYSLIPMIKRDKLIRIIGLINITIFMFYDFYIKLYNLVFLDIFIIIIFIYGIYVNDYKIKQN